MKLNEGTVTKKKRDDCDESSIALERGDRSGSAALGPVAVARADALRRQIVYKTKKITDGYSDPLDLTASLASPLVSVVHVRQAILTSTTHIPSPQGSPGDAKIDISHR